MRGLDLFTGIGGFSLGMQAAGIEVVAHSEIEPFPCAVLEERFPGVPNLGDISRVTREQIDALGPIDVVTFGSPCQDFSVAGKRLGMKGYRSSLFHEAIRVIRDAEPGIAVWENVPGVFSSAAGWDFAAVLDEMAELGAVDIAWRVLDAQFFGVPQRRRRVFLVADFAGERAGEILFEPEGVRRHPAPGRAKGQEAARSTGGGSQEQGHVPRTAYSLTARNSQDRPEKEAAMRVAAPFVPEARGKRVFGERDRSYYREGFATLSAREHKDHGSNLVTHALTDAFRSSEDGTGRGTPLVASPMGFHSTQDPVTTEDGTPCLGTGNSQGYGHRAVALAENQRGESRLSATHPQLTTGGGKPGQGYPAAMQGMAVRRLTPLECGRLQGFPEPGGKDWCEIRFKGKKAADGPKYRAYGNAVAVPVVTWIMRRLVEATS